MFYSFPVPLFFVSSCLRGEIFDLGCEIFGLVLAVEKLPELKIAHV